MVKLFTLIIEDDPELADIFDFIVSSLEIETEIIFDGRKALDRLSQITPDIILLDIKLPQVSGLTILDYIQTHGRLADTKVVICTANPRAMTYLDDKVDLILIKPVAFNQMRTLIERLINSIAQEI